MSAARSFSSLSKAFDDVHRFEPINAMQDSTTTSHNSFSDFDAKSFLASVCKEDFLSIANSTSHILNDGDDKTFSQMDFLTSSERGKENVFASKLNALS